MRGRGRRGGGENGLRDNLVSYYSSRCMGNDGKEEEMMGVGEAWRACGYPLPPLTTRGGGGGRGKGEREGIRWANGKFVSTLTMGRRGGEMFPVALAASFFFVCVCEFYLSASSSATSCLAITY